MATGDISTKYGTAVAMTITSWSSLATASTLLVGAESAAVTSDAVTATDYLVSGKIQVGTTPTTAKQIQIWAIGSWDGTIWPDVFAGTDAARTIVNAEQKQGACQGPVFAVAVISTTSNLYYPFGPISIRGVFGGTLPKKWSLFLTHETVAALNTGHSVYYQPVYENVA